MDSANPLPQVYESENAVRQINALLDALGHAGLFGRNAETCEDLTWGWLGARFYSTLYNNGTLTVAANTTSYVTKRKDDNSDPEASTATTNWDNTADYYRIAKLVSGPTAITSWEDHRLGWLFGVAGEATGSGGMPSYHPQCFAIACGDETTPITAGTNKVTFRLPFAMTSVSVMASLTAAQTSGSIFTVDINENGSSILSTKLTIDNTEETSATAATPAVVSDTSLAALAEITIDVDQIGNGTAAGLKVYITGMVAV